MSPEFLVTSLIVVATPGTGVIYTLAAGLARGARESVVAAAGCTLGIVPHMAAAITGLAALLHTSAVAFATLKYLGVAYLLYLAWSTLREKGTLAVEGEDAPQSARKTIATAVLINVLNPKLTIFFLAFLPQFVDPGRTVWTQVLILGLAFVALGFLSDGLYALAAGTLARWLRARRRVLRYASGSVFVGLGVSAALAKRT
jgi:threonine/homoserine/homoserine lactone efflux protein